MKGALAALAVALVVAVPAMLFARRLLARRRRPARYAHLTDKQWEIRRAVLRARRSANALNEPPITHQRYASDRPFGRLRPRDGE